MGSNRNEVVHRSSLLTGEKKELETLERLLAERNKLKEVGLGEYDVVAFSDNEPFGRLLVETARQLGAEPDEMKFVGDIHFI